MSRNLLYDYLRAVILPLAEIDKLIPQKGKILDLGCGEGIIAKHLANISTRKVIGIDNDQKRLPKSQKSNLSFVLSDIRSYDLNSPDAVIISDVLHHLNLKDQKKFLTKIAKKLKKDGVLLLKEIDTNEFIRSRLSRFWDLVLYPQDKVHYHTSHSLKAYLESLGFIVTVTRPVRLFPGSTTLFFCQKK